MKCMIELNPRSRESLASPEAILEVPLSRAAIKTTRYITNAGVHARYWTLRNVACLLSCILHCTTAAAAKWDMSGEKGNHSKEREREGRKQSPDARVN